MFRIVILAALIGLFVVASLPADPPTEERALTVVAIGDAGERNRLLRASAETMTDMLTERHDGGVFDALFFLGDNFYDTGLNLPVDDVEGKIKDVLGPFREVMTRLGPEHVHAIAGNHDYYRRNAIETSLIFGLVTIEEGPVGISDRGNEREAAIPFWRYYYRMPAAVEYPLPGTRDTVQFILIDSALPLRTRPSVWSDALDSLRRLLTRSAHSPGIRWRVLAMHHPWQSVGKHGGYTVWNDETNTVERLTNCDKDSNAVAWLLNWLDPQDLCTERYQAYLDSLRSVIHDGRTKIHLLLSAHEHSLQLLNYGPHAGGCAYCPGVHVISGAGSRPTRVKAPNPPVEFTSSPADPLKEGISPGGFVQLRFDHDRVRIVFWNAMAGERLSMGGGKDEFWLTPGGTLTIPDENIPKEQ